MISVVMPYWQRQEILDLNLKTYRDLYSRTNIEIIIVDDGSPEPAIINGELPWPVHLVRMPSKDGALNPCTAFNVGVSASCGDILVLTNPEIVHRSPILAAMSDELGTLGSKGYVAAACWGVRGNWWHCHSSDGPKPGEFGRAKMPKDAGLHFCAMLYRSFYDEIGGFCEGYRDGKGYEDNDLLWKLHAAGAVFRIRDDLVTDHQDCPGSTWPYDGAARNRAIFESRWGAA